MDQFRNEPHELRMSH